MSILPLYYIANINIKYVLMLLADNQIAHISIKHYQCKSLIIFVNISM